MEGKPMPRRVGAGVERERSSTEFLKSARELELNGYAHHASLHNPGGKDPKPYHSIEHVYGVVERAEQLAKVFNLSERERALMRLAIARHDNVMEYDPYDPEHPPADLDDPALRIRRHRGAREGDLPSGIKGNEARSAELLRKDMEIANRLARHEIFSEEDKSLVTWAIDSTYPDVKGGPFRDYPYFTKAIGQNPALEGLITELERHHISGPLFLQPHLEVPLERGEQVPRVVLAVALADLDGCGMIDPSAFFAEGDHELQELSKNLRKPWILTQLLQGRSRQDRENRVRVRDACLEWLGSQAGFAAWQALRFEKIVYLLKAQDDLSKEEEQKLRKECSRFIENSQAALARSEELRRRFATPRYASMEGVYLANLLVNLGFQVERGHS